MVYALLFLTLFLNSVPSASLVLKPYPLDAWNGALTVEAARVSRGLPQYEDRLTGHATHLYGALTSALLGHVFQWTGPSNVTARWFSWIAAFLLAAGISVTVFSRSRGFYVLFGFTAIWAINLRVANYFISARPDLMAALLATAAALLLYRSGRSPRGGLQGLLGILLMVVAFFFKQTAAMVALIPPLALLLAYRQVPASDRRRAWVASLLPLGAIFVCVAGLWLFFPWPFHYMIDVQRKQPIHLAEILPKLEQVLCGTPLFLVALFDGVRRVVTRQARFDARMAWLLAAVMVCTAASVVTWAKLGGAVNSMLPALLAQNVLALVWMREFLCERIQNRNPLHQGGLLVLALLVSVSSLIQSPLYQRLMGERTLLKGGYPSALKSAGQFRGKSMTRSAEYRTIITAVRELPGKVLCPVDPTIPLLAKGEVGRSMVLEYDSLCWPETLPHYLQKELEEADYVIEVLGTQYSNQVDARQLSQWGFVRTETPGTWQFYAVWKNEKKRP